MLGAETIKGVRDQGLKPAIVFVFDLGNIRNDGWFSPDDMLQNGFIPEIHIQPNDTIAALDFRFLTGCVVSVLSNNKDRARDIFKYMRIHRPKSITVSDGTFVHHEVFNE